MEQESTSSESPTMWREGYRRRRKERELYLIEHMPEEQKQTFIKGWGWRRERRRERERERERVSVGVRNGCRTVRWLNKQNIPFTFRPGRESKVIRLSSFLCATLHAESRWGGCVGLTQTAESGSLALHTQTTGVWFQRVHYEGPLAKLGLLNPFYSLPGNVMCPVDPSWCPHRWVLTLLFLL